MGVCRGNWEVRHAVERLKIERIHLKGIYGALLPHCPELVVEVGSGTQPAVSGSAEHLTSLHPRSPPETRLNRGEVGQEGFEADVLVENAHVRSKLPPVAHAHHNAGAWGHHRGPCGHGDVKPGVEPALPPNGLSVWGLSRAEERTDASGRGRLGGEVSEQGEMGLDIRLRLGPLRGSPGADVWDGRRCMRRGPRTGAEDMLCLGARVGCLAEVRPADGAERARGGVVSVHKCGGRQSFEGQGG